jgi:hypothetical protein
MSSSAGLKRPGVTCGNCNGPFSLFLAVQDMVSVERLTDPFDAKCPLCGHQASYPKSSIGILVAVGPQ